MTYKVIDAKDGAVTKFEYEGATFKAVEGRDPKVGDYLVITDKESAYYLTHVIANKPYLIKGKDGHGDCMFVDERGVTRNPYTADYSHAIYEKVEPPKETITHEGRAYKLVDRKAQPGDVVIISAGHKSIYVTAGVPYRVVKGGTYDLSFINNDGVKLGLYHSGRTESNVNVYEPIAPKKRLIYRDLDGVTHTVLDAELVAYSSVEEGE